MANDNDKDKNKEEKTFMENAKGFLSSWQDDYEKKNKDILERKKKRDQEAEKEHEEFLKNLEAVKGDLKEKAEKLSSILNREYEGFKDSLQKGAASMHEKFQLQEHFDNFKTFLKKAGQVGEEKFKELTTKVEKDLSEIDNSKLTIEKPKTEQQEFDEIMKQAEKLLENDLNQKEEEIDENHSKINKLFNDLEKE